MHAQLGVDHGALGGVAHARGPDWVVDEHQAPAQVGFQVGALDDLRRPA